MIVELFIYTIISSILPCVIYTYYNDYNDQIIIIQ